MALFENKYHILSIVKSIISFGYHVHTLNEHGAD